jgi:hypothetical protein
MSITIETIILCDGDSPDCETGGGALGCGDGRHQGAREQLKGRGWLSRNGKHYCPECRKQVEGGAE